MNPVTNQSVKADIKFDTSSVGYQAILAAASGQLEKLKECYAEDRKCLSELQVVTEKGDRYTATHYGLTKRQFKAVAYLLNQGVAWDICSQKSQGKGSTAIAMLNGIENGLCQLLQGLVDSEDPINLTALVSLLTSSQLGTDRRREVINNPELRWNLCKKLKKDDALFVMGTLLVGSHQWKRMQTDFPMYALTANIKDVLESNKTMCCNQMILYTSVLTGTISPQGAMDIYKHNAPEVKMEDHAKLTSHLTSYKERHALMFPFNQQIAINLGLVERSTDKLLNLKIAHHGEPLTQIIYFEAKDGMIDHYGILHRNVNGNYLVHITQRTQCVLLEDAQTAIKTENILAPHKAVYTGMLPQHQ